MQSSRSHFRGQSSENGALKLPTVEKCTRVGCKKGSPGCSTRESFRKKSSRKPKVEPQPKEPSELRFLGVRPDWDNRAHVSFSKDNKVLPKLHRNYFDHLPSVTIRHGNYRQPQPHAGSHETFTAAPPEVHRWVIEQRLASHQQKKLPVVEIQTEEAEETGEDQSRKSSVVEVEPEESAQEDPMEAASTEPLVPVDMLLAAVLSKPTRSMSEASDFDRLDKTTVGQRSDFRKILTDGHGQEALRHFHNWCQKKFGSALAAWKQLDEDGGWTISKSEFSKGMKILNYTGDTRMLWDAFDRDHSGTISFLHFDPEGAFALAAFKRWAEVKFGSVKKCCEQFDTDRNGSLSRDEFLKALLSNGFPAEGPLWSVLAFATNEIKSTGRTNLTEISLRNIEVIEALPCPEYLWTAPEFEGAKFFKQTLFSEYRGNGLLAWRELDRDGAMRVNWHSFQEAFRRLENKMKRKHDSKKLRQTIKEDEEGIDDQEDQDEIVRTLQKESNVQPSGQRVLRHSVTSPAAFERFSTSSSFSAISGTSFTSNFRNEKRFHPEKEGLSQYTAAGVWRALDKDLSGWVSLREFDEDVFTLLSSFRGFILNNFGNMAEAFKSFFGGKNSVTRKDFLRALRKHEVFRDDQINTIFEGLDLNGSQRITIEELRFFDRWRFDEDEHEELAWGKLQPVRRQISFVRAVTEDLEAQAEEEKEAAPIEKTFSVRGNREKKDAMRSKKMHRESSQVSTQAKASRTIPNL